MFVVMIFSCPNLQSGRPRTTFWCLAQATLYQVGATDKL